MCYCALVIKTEKEVKENNLQKIYSMFSEKMENNPDGFGLVESSEYSYRSTNKQFFLDKFQERIKRFHNQDKNSWMMLHARQATVGDVHLDNCHCWNINDYKFAHNGWISGLGNKKQSDSLVYFKNLINTINQKKDIVEAIKSYKNFSGRAFLATPDNTVYIYGDFKVYLLDNLIVIASFASNFDDYIIRGDLFFQAKQRNIPQCDIDGIYVLENGEVLFKDRMPEEKTYYRYNSRIDGFQDKWDY